MEVAPELKNCVNVSVRMTSRKSKVIRDTPVGKTEEVEDWGTCIFVLAETVASRSLSSTSTHPETTGRTAP
jgi:hypothetical protein